MIDTTRYPMLSDVGNLNTQVYWLDQFFRQQTRRQQLNE